MITLFKDRYVLFSLASVCVILFICAVGSFNTDAIDGNGMTEIEGVISDPVASQNGTVFKITDLSGNEFRCFSGSAIPDAPVLCRLTGSFSSDGNMFFVKLITVSEAW
ncbi:MAG: hypothetical protein FWD81_03155 [Methanomassiliicoccaceae archaeon]|nr:hypothetical protein [Methanomassiliicoccaceae archaeon]